MSKYQELKRTLLASAAKQSIPAVVEFEISTSCNLDCKMCYLKGIHNEGAPSLSQWQTLFLEARDAGMLYATLTGGETFLSPDFILLYQYLFDLGVKVGIFTNGTIWNGSLQQCFEKRPPEFVAVTLYGGSEETYQIVTGKKAHSLVLSNLHQMKNAGLPLLVRTIPIQPIFSDLPLLIEQVKSLDLSLGYFLYLSVHDEISKTWRLSPKQLHEFETTIRSAFPAYEDQIVSKGFKDCNALKNSCFVDHRMHIRPCSTAPYPYQTYKPGRFLQQFHDLAKEWESIEVEACTGCSFQHGCISCKARLLLEQNELHCTTFLLDIAKRRSS